MLIHEMTPEECREALMHADFGRLACARDGQPYVVPVYFAYDAQHDREYQGRHLYLFSPLGQKIEWMRLNPLVCVEIDDVKSYNQWQSVVILGRYEELTDTPECQCARVRALELLQKRATWWKPGSVSVLHRGESKSFTPVIYRIHINHMTGHRATPEETTAMVETTTRPTKKHHWLSSLLHPTGQKN